MNIRLFPLYIKAEEIISLCTRKKGVIDLTYIEGKKWNDPFVWQDTVASWKEVERCVGEEKAMTFWKRRWDSQLISVQPTYDQNRRFPIAGEDNLSDSETGAP